MSETILKMRGVCKSFPGVKALQNVDFDLLRGEVHVLIGENGAGKSTILNATLGLISKESGTIDILGNTTLDNATKEEVGVVFDGSGYPDVMAPRTIGRILSKVYKSWDAALYESMLERFGLPKDKALKKFSKGMKMKFAITAAMAHRPKLLVLDEATSALDSESEQLVQDALSTLMRGRTSIVVAHRLSTVAALDRIVVLADGEIVEDGTHAQLVEAGGEYASLWSRQTGAFLEA